MGAAIDDEGPCCQFPIGDLDDRLYDHRDLEFYRGFCCLANTKPDYQRQELAEYIEAMERDRNSDDAVHSMSGHNHSISGRGSVEDQYLSFTKFFYDGKSADYGHIEAGDGVTCYAPDSPFKAADLQKYGPFSCLDDDERTKGVHSPYIYIGRSHTFFPWHNGMSP